jgi:hypothetical protein
MQADAESQGRRQVVVYTQITAQLIPPPYRTPRLQFIDNELANPVILQLCPLPYPQSIPGRSPASLSMFSNAIQFFSVWDLNQETKFTIYDGDQVVREEKESLRVRAGPGETGKGWIYECDIAGVMASDMRVQGYVGPDLPLVTKHRVLNFYSRQIPTASQFSRP